MHEPAFVIKQAVGALLWSPEGGRFTSLELSEVVMNTRPALDLLRAVGPDGFSMLFALAASASLDDTGQLVVVGGVERLRALMDWKRDKAQRVFRELLEHGFVSRNQGTTIGGDGRRHFVATVLVLHPRLYQPSRDDENTATSGPVGVQAAQPVVTGPNEPGGSEGGGGGTDDSGTGSPASGNTHSSTGTVDSGTGRTRNGASSGSTGTARTGSGDGTPAHTATGIPGCGGAGPTHDMDDDEKDHASSAGTPNAADGEHAALVQALKSLGFADAVRVVDTTEREMLVNSLQYVLTSTTTIGNPGAYLRRLLRSGGVRRPDREQLALELASTLRTVRVESPVVSPPSSIPDENQGPGFDGDALDAFLDSLDDTTRAAMEAQVDTELATVPVKFRRHTSVFAAMRRYQLAKLAGIVDEEGD